MTAGHCNRAMRLDGCLRRLHSADNDTDKWLEQMIMKALAKRNEIAIRNLQGGPK